MSRRKSTTHPAAHPAAQQIADIATDDDTRDILLAAVQRRIYCKTEMDRLKNEIDKDLNPAIKVLLESLGVRRVLYEDWSCGFHPWSNSHISADLLLLEGVTTDVIEACRVSQSGETVDALQSKKGKGGIK